MLGGRNMKKLAKPILIVILFTLGLAIVCNVRAQNGGIMETYFDSEMSNAIRVQVNATAQTQPNGNLTVSLCLTPVSGVSVENFTLDVYGFVNGTTPTVIGNIRNDTDLPTGTYNKSSSVSVPDDVWGTTFGNMTLIYSMSTSPGALYSVTCGFYMTNVENTFLESLETQFNDLNESYYNLTNVYSQLNQTFVQLQGNYTKLQQNYTKLQGNVNQLGNARQVAVVLAITTVFFVATTIFLVIRRPKESL
jgi:hypothetical protein